ncbi:MAG: hypothetical protein AAF662_06295 [Pseudomonadota bacterium]
MKEAIDVYFGPNGSPEAIATAATVSCATNRDTPSVRLIDKPNWVTDSNVTLESTDTCSCSPGRVTMEWIISFQVAPPRPSDLSTIGMLRFALDTGEAVRSNESGIAPERTMSAVLLRRHPYSTLRLIPDAVYFTKEDGAFFGELLCSLTNASSSTKFFFDTPPSGEAGFSVDLTASQEAGPNLYALKIKIVPGAEDTNNYVLPIVAVEHGKEVARASLVCNVAQDQK